MRILEGRIVDDGGRTLILRGCNLGGSSKVPVDPPGETWRPDSLRERSNVSFVGRPFPLEEAEEHFKRFRRWGFTFLRFILTWEAIEHGGPGVYDEAYLAYVRKILKVAEKEGISVFMDPHQDVWSRWTGGDGAPAWTLQKIGINVDRLFETGAALTQQEYPGPFPRMIWPTNYNRYAAATLFTLFFAGETYAKETCIDGQNAQTWLQERYIAAFRHAYRRLKDCGAIVGWGTMNEPHGGFIGYRNLENLENNPIATGPIPSAFQSMAVASGHSVTVPVYATGITGTKIRGYQTINPHRLSLFSEGFTCPWKQTGVWTDEGGEARLLKRDYFATIDGRPVRFVEDFLKPFIHRFIQRMAEANERAFFFIEGLPNGEHPTWQKEEAPVKGAAQRVVNAFHWYDGATLFSKTFKPWFSVRSDNRMIVLGKKNVQKSFSEQLAHSVDWTKNQMGGIPALLGEFGLPFDLNGRGAFSSGDYGVHEKALSMYYDAIDANLLHSTIWDFTAQNDHTHGDGWNDEDLSIWSEGRPRALDGWRRPYPMATAGLPRSFTWDRKRRRLEYHFEPDYSISEPTVIFAPSDCFGGEPTISVTNTQGEAVEGLRFEWDEERLLMYFQESAHQKELILRLEI